MVLGIWECTFAWFYSVQKPLDFTLPMQKPVFQIWLSMPPWFSTQMSMWRFRLNMSRLWHHRQNCSHHLWYLSTWQLQLCNELGLELTLRCQQNLSPLPSKYTCNLPTPYSSPIPQWHKPPPSPPRITMAASSLVSLFCILPPWVYFRKRSQSSPPQSEGRSCYCHA